MLAETECVHIKGADSPGACSSAAGRHRNTGRRPHGNRLWSAANGNWPRSPACWTRRSAARAVSSAWSGRRASARAASSLNSRRVAAGRGCRGVLHLLRISRQRHPVPCGGPAAAGGVRGRTNSPTRRPASRFGPEFPSADAEDLLLLDDLLGIRDPRCRSPMIDADARRRRLTALVNAASLARTDAGCVRDRGCALDRPGQRVDAGRFSVGRSRRPRRWC